MLGRKGEDPDDILNRLIDIYKGAVEMWSREIKCRRCGEKPAITIHGLCMDCNMLRLAKEELEKYKQLAKTERGR
jgi:ribosomal protein L37E